MAAKRAEGQYMSEMGAFETYCSNLNELCKSMQDTKEAVSRLEVERALEHAKSIELNAAADVLLFCASINLMNAYVKQPGCRSFGYFFKGYVFRLLDRIHRNPIEGVSYDTQMDGNNAITYVEVCGIQFSFHCVDGAKPIEQSSSIRFDGVRKQRCAVTLFKMAEANYLTHGKDYEKSFQRTLKASCNRQLTGRREGAKGSPETNRRRPSWLATTAPALPAPARTAEAASPTAAPAPT